MIFGGRYNVESKKCIVPVWNQRSWSDSYDHCASIAYQRSYTGRLITEFDPWVGKFVIDQFTPFLETSTFWIGKKEYGQMVISQPWGLFHKTVAYEHRRGTYEHLPPHSDGPVAQM
jgi:hypothetical protein